ncbi:hypothetical protein CRUP_023486 [Coryphaenoides rupestris]|nr:hypothetical protein CRUP_023486 [Coryphaenoides rupestris]
MERSPLALFLTLCFCSLQHVFSLPHKDVCLLQVDEGPCRASMLRYYYNTLTQKCEEFHYGGCQGNANNFKSYQECQKTCFMIPRVQPTCRFPPDVGPCRALHLRYFFNMTTMQCESFQYGGCRGNANRFRDLTFCHEYCSPHQTLPVLCLDVLDRGRCSASLPRYYYKASTRTCEKFSYSGCGGSSNNFVSKESCMNGGIRTKAYGMDDG